MTCQCSQASRLGVPERDMYFSGEPTSDFDNAGEYLRVWYEANHPDKKVDQPFWDRLLQRFLFGPGLPRDLKMDSFMLGLINEVGRIEDERKRQVAA